MVVVVVVMVEAQGHTGRSCILPILFCAKQWRLDMTLQAYLIHLFFQDRYRVQAIPRLWS